MGKSLVSTIEYGYGYSASPRNMTDPRFTYKISTPIPNDDEQELLLKDHSNYCMLLQNRMYMVLCYKKKCEEDSGWHIGGWFKESLGKALLENPILAGRLRTTQDEGGLEIVSNDSGVRCFEAHIPMTLDEFLESQEKNDVHAQLVYWKDVDRSDLQFSPLVYVQVTNFECGGYAVGISFSLLLADPMLISNFLNKWADFHQTMAYDGEIPKMPVFYTPKFKRVGVGCSSPNSTKITSNSSIGLATKTTMFSISTDHEKLTHLGDEIYKYFVLLCIEEAETKIGIKMSSNFTLITRSEPKGDVKVETCSKKGIFGSPEISLKYYELNPLSWESLRTYEIAFRSGNLPIDVSHWVASDDATDHGLVHVAINISSPKDTKSTCIFNVLVMLPNPGH